MRDGLRRGDLQPCSAARASGSVRTRGLNLRLADRELCTDNAAMIGILAERKLLRGERANLPGCRGRSRPRADLINRSAQDPPATSPLSTLER